MKTLALKSYPAEQPGLPWDLLCWMKDEVLPFWAEAGFCADTGLFHERLTLQGRPDHDCALRMRVQFRQIYVYSNAAVLGWFPQGAELAHRVWRRLLQTAYSTDGQTAFAHLLSPQGAVADSRSDSYDHAFAVLAAAWLYRATGERTVQQVLERLLAFADRHLTDELGALRDNVAGAPVQRQNTQMHWFEAMIALQETGAHGSAARRALRHRRLLEENLVDATTDIIGENYTSTWQAYPGGLGQIVEPGHMVEWVWLLRRHEAVFNHPGSDLPDRLMRAALSYQCAQSGLLVDECRRDGTVTKGTRRIWLQTELLKAHIAQYEAGWPAALDAAHDCLLQLDTHYLRKPFPQGWIDQLDAATKPIMSHVPASILYHVFVALSEVERVLPASASEAGMW